MSTALIITDKKTNNIVHTIVCKDEDSINKYIMKDDPKLNYQIVPNWSFDNEDTWVRHITPTKAISS